jgi:hypothetical protein
MQFYDSLLGHDPDPQFNSRGHRCKEIEDLSLHNYILFAGDNVALGLDKPVEETFPYLVSKKLNMDYYNLSIFNGGLDAIRYNLITWNHIQPVKPRLIVVASEFLNSFLVSNKSYSHWAACDTNDEKVKDLFDAGNYNAFFITKQVLADKLLRNIINTPIYQVAFKDKISLFTDGITNLKHDGDITDHQSIAQSIVSQFNKHTRMALP